MAAIVAARFNQGSVTQGNVTPLWKARSPISMRPVEYAGASAYSTYRSRHPRRLRVEPAASIRKRLFDLVVASAALLFFAPLLIVVAIAIKATSRGPVLFVQRRYGYRNRSFKIYKFRTMRTDAGDWSLRGAIAPLNDHNQRRSSESGPAVTHMGSATLSRVVRPSGAAASAADRRHGPPGITGLAQVNGCRGSTVEPNRAISRIDYDLHYIEKWSLSMDILIIVRTIRREFLSGSGF